MAIEKIRKNLHFLGTRGFLIGSKIVFQDKNDASLEVERTVLQWTGYDSSTRLHTIVFDDSPNGEEELVPDKKTYPVILAEQAWYDAVVPRTKIKKRKSVKHKK